MHHIVIRRFFDVDCTSSRSRLRIFAIRRFQLRQMCRAFPSLVSYRTRFLDKPAEALLSPLLLPDIQIYQTPFDELGPRLSGTVQPHHTDYRK